MMITTRTITRVTVGDVPDCLLEDIIHGVLSTALYEISRYEDYKNDSAVKVEHDADKRQQHSCLEEPRPLIHQFYALARVSKKWRRILLRPLKRNGHDDRPVYLPWQEKNKNDRFIQAIERNDVDTARLYLLEEVDVKLTHNDNYAICWVKSAEILKMLLLNRSRGIDPIVKWQTPIINACELGNVDMINLLLAEPTVFPGVLLNTPLIYACFSGYTEVVKTLLQDKRVFPQYGVTWVGTPFSVACERGYYDIVRLLLDWTSSSQLHLEQVGTDLEMFGKVPRPGSNSSRCNVRAFLINDPKKYPQEKWNKLFSTACEKGCTGLIEILLQHQLRFDPSFRLSSDFAHQCIKTIITTCQNAFLLIFLIDNGWVDPTDKEDYALRLACKKGVYDIVDMLLNRYSPESCTPDNDDYDCKEDKEIQVTDKDQLTRRRLKLHQIKYTVNPCAKNGEPLLVACQNNHRLIVQRLLKDPRVSATEAAFRLACENDNVHIAEDLLSDATIASAMETSLELRNVYKKMKCNRSISKYKDNDRDTPINNNGKYDVRDEATIDEYGLNKTIPPKSNTPYDATKKSYWLILAKCWKQSAPKVFELLHKNFWLTKFPIHRDRDVLKKSKQNKNPIFYGSHIMDLVECLHQIGERKTVPQMNKDHS